MILGIQSFNGKMASRNVKPSASMTVDSRVSDRFPGLLSTPASNQPERRMKGMPMVW